MIEWFKHLDLDDSREWVWVGFFKGAASWVEQVDHPVPQINVRMTFKPVKTGEVLDLQVNTHIVYREESSKKPETLFITIVRDEDITNHLADISLSARWTNDGPKIYRTEIGVKSSVLSDEDVDSIIALVGSSFEQPGEAYVG